MPTSQNLEEIRKHCSEIALSHELHSSKLEYLGVRAAIRGFCIEFAKQHDVNIVFKNENVPRKLSSDMSVCLFRVAHEALDNAINYSGTRHFYVAIRGFASEVQLVVKDAGVGFDVDAAMKARGLGLVSMQERLHLVRGHLRVDSKPG